MRHLLNLLFLFAPMALFAQSGNIKGIVTDQVSGETLPMATVILEGTTTGAQTDLDGNYSFDCPVGTYRLVCTFVGFEKQVKSIVVVAGQNLEVNYSLPTEATTIEAVVVTAKANTTSVTAVNALVQKTPAMLTGVSREDMRRTPDRNTADVLKRLSGTSIQENKFVIVRGLNDRYNVTLVNGFQIPSSEPDRRSFSFDLFPAALLDNLIVYKTASPDLPGEFAGGVIAMNTREIPETNFLQFTVGVGVNSQTTFKPFITHEGGALEGLGIDNGSRDLDDKLPSTGAYKQQEDNVNKSRANAKRFGSQDWSTQRSASIRPATNVQIAGARSYDFGNDSRLGVLGAILFSNTPRFVDVQARTNYDGSTILSTGIDSQFVVNSSIGGMLNLTYQIDPTSRFIFTNVVNSTTNDRVTQRNIVVAQQGLERNTQIGLVANTMINSQFRGEHNFSGYKFNWGVTGTSLRRDMPGMLTNSSRLDEGSPEGSQYYNSILANQSIFNGNMFFADQRDNATGASADLSIPYALFTPKDKNSIKVGFNVNRLTREYEARLFSYTTLLQPGFDSLFFRPLEVIYNDRNITNGNIRLKESTTASDSYDANQTIPVAFLMVDQYVTNKFRVTLGVRAESFRQRLELTGFNAQSLNLDTTYINYLPSINTSYSFNDRHRVRASASQTVSRPTFREISPFAYTNFDELVIYQGNSTLRQATINNYDLRYEFFPTRAQMVAVGVFYKQFNNPIEQRADASSSFGRNVTYWNAPTAVNSGVELEYRFKLAQEAPILSRFTVLGNLAFINSTIDLSKDLNAPEKERPLQGQSPYVINAGLNYNNYEKGTDVTLMYNRIGRRIWQVGYSSTIADTWEAPRDIVDFNITQRIFKKGEVKFSIQDILNQPLDFYMDFDKSGKYEQGTAVNSDILIQRYRFGTNYNLQLSWKIGE